MRVVIRQSLAGLFLLLVFPGAALAGEGLNFMPPPGCLPADGGPGFPIHVYVWGTQEKPGALGLVTDTGSIEPAKPLGSGVYAAMFRPSKLKMRGKATLRGTWKSGKQTIRGFLRIPVCPHPTGIVRVRAEPEKLLAGEGQQAFLHISVTDAEGKPQAGLPLVITTNVGRIKRLRDLGEGKYQAVYLPPGDPFPQVGIIMVANPIGARLDRVAVGRVVIPITARIELPGKTARGTKMIMEIAGKRFGPVKADRRGRFKLPILVPPGYQRGKATSIDRVGNRRTRLVSFYLPETNQLGLWGYPRVLPADGESKSRLLVTTIDPYGTPIDIGGVKVAAKHGKISNVKDIGKGMYEAYYTAPGTTAKGNDELTVSFPKGGRKSQAMLEVLLLPGPVDQVEVWVPKLLPADNQTQGKIEVDIRDERGNPVGGQRVALSVSTGKLSEVKETSPGRHEATVVVPPDQKRWLADVWAEVRDIGGKVPRRIMVSKDSLIVEGENRFLEVVLVDGTGRPVFKEPVEVSENGHVLKGVTGIYGRVRVELTRPKDESPRRCLILARKGWLKRVVYWVEAGAESRLLPYNLDSVLPPNAPLRQEARIKLHPATEVYVSVFADPPSRPGKPWRLRAEVTDASGKPAMGRQVRFSVSGGKLGVVREVKDGWFEAELRPGASGWGRIVVSAVDSQSHVGAVTQIVETGRGP
jgi:hypothetical protein